MVNSSVPRDPIYIVLLTPDNGNPLEPPVPVITGAQQRSLHPGRLERPTPLSGLQCPAPSFRANPECTYLERLDEELKRPITQLYPGSIFLYQVALLYPVCSIL